MSPAGAFLLGLAGLAGAAAALWRPAKRLSVLVWLLALPLGLWAYWAHPGAIPGVLGMPVVFFVLRANAARLAGPDLSPGRYLEYVLDLTKPLPREEVAPPARRAIGRRALRGVALLALGLCLIVMGTRLQLWRTLPYLEDLLVLAEAAILFTAGSDLILAALWAGGRRTPDRHDGTFVAACSLRQFWRRWNGVVSQTLLRGLFLPLVRGARRLGATSALALGTVCAFAFTGLLHALPLVLATPQRTLNLWLFGTTQAFFLAHGLAVVAEGVVPDCWTRGWSGRVWVWTVWAGTAWLYPGPLAALVGLHGRTFESLTVFAVFGG